VVAAQFFVSIYLPNVRVISCCCIVRWPAARSAERCPAHTSIFVRVQARSQGERQVRAESGAARAGSNRHGGSCWGAGRPGAWTAFPTSCEARSLSALTIYTSINGQLALATPASIDSAALSKMSDELNKGGTAQLTLPEDANVLTRDSQKDVYAVLTYTAKL
jgi:hypothetical protein